MDIESVATLPDELDRIAERDHRASFYQTTTWCRSLGTAFPAMEVRSLIARDDGTIVGYLPYFVIVRGLLRSVWSMPFGTYGGPVAPDEHVATALVERLDTVKRAAGAHEVGVVDFWNRIDTTGFEVQRERTHIIDLREGFESVWARFDKSKRRQTRKGEREGLSVITATTGQVRDYYDIYVRRMKAWREPVQYPLALFTSLCEAPQARARLFLVYDGETLIGGHLNFYFGNTVTAWNGVTRRDRRATQASTLLYARCIEHACQNGYQFYNLGASLGKESLSDYKKALGGVAHDYRIARWRSTRGRLVSRLRKFKSRF